MENIGSNDQVSHDNDVDELVEDKAIEEPKDFSQANQDDNRLNYMSEEINQIEKKQTWELVPRPTYKNIIGAK